MSIESQEAAGIPARWWRKGDKDLLECLLCYRSCKLPPRVRGYCQVRENRQGELRSLNWGHTGAMGMDPVEKKPLYHFLPGTSTFSVGAPGCNLSCLGCQNFRLSRPGLGYGGVISPGNPIPDMMKMAKEKGAASVSLTYSEPTVFFEYAQDIGRAAHEASLPVIWVTNGSMNPEILKELSISAMNIDLKGFTEFFYKTVAGGSLAAVMGNIENALAAGIWVEVTTLLIPGLNDSEDELTKLAHWLCTLSKDLPWHISRFFPRYRQRHIPPTPIESLVMARCIGKAEGLRHVYLGNAPVDEHANTYCQSCGKTLIKRIGYSVALDLVSGKGYCPKCRCQVAGRWGEPAE
jgi:pyruvate formate lyase activating enzyme